MAKLQYTYRSAASLSDETIAYIKAGVENAGSFPKFVDSLIAANMEAGREIEVLGEDAESPLAEKKPAVPFVAGAADVDFSGVEAKIEEARKDILAAILERMSFDEDKARAAVEPPTQSAESAAKAGDITRNDLVSLRKAVASDIIKAKDEEIEKLDELLGAIEAAKIQIKDLAESGIKAPAPVVAAGKGKDYGSRLSAMVEDVDITGLPGDEAPLSNSYSAVVAEETGSLAELPFEDEDFARGIGDLLGDDDVSEPVEDPDPDLVPVYQEPARDYAPAYSTDEEDDDDGGVFEYDEDTLLGAQVLLGMA